MQVKLRVRLDLLLAGALGLNSTGWKNVFKSLAGTSELLFSRDRVLDLVEDDGDSDDDGAT